MPKAKRETFLKKYRFGIALILVVILLAVSGFAIIKSPTISHVVNPLCKDCNVIIFHFDTLSANHLLCNGYLRDTAPNLCKIGNDNINVKTFYTNATWTLPSTVSILTSLEPEYHNVVKIGDKLSPKIPFLPEILQKNGYETYFYLPNDIAPLPLHDVYNRGITKVKSEGYGTLEYLDNALKYFLTNIKEGKKTFSYVQTYYIHAPYYISDAKTLYTDAPSPNIPRSQDEFDEKFYSIGLKEYLFKPDVKALSPVPPEPSFYLKLSNATTNAERKQIMNTRNFSWVSPIQYFYYRDSIDITNKTQTEYLRALYDQKIHELDNWIGKSLVPFLNNPDIKKNTLVIIMSDHGEEFAEHNAIFHDTLYENNVRVPFIVQIPGIKNREINTPAQSIDMVPTILDVLGVNQSDYSFQGQSIAPLFVNDLPMNRLFYADGFGDKEKTIRYGNWKIFLHFDGKSDDYLPDQLYDIKADPNELNNVLNDHEDMVKSIMDKYTVYKTKWHQATQKYF
jgi:arylsulfatase A-like enzyme